MQHFGLGGILWCASALAMANEVSSQSMQQLDLAIDRLVSQFPKVVSPEPVYIRPVVVAKRQYRTPFSDYLTSQVKFKMAALGYRVLSDQTVKNTLGNTRGLRVKAKKVEKLSHSDALFTGAGQLLNGVYTKTEAGLTVSLSLSDVEGVQLATVEQLIPIVDVPLQFDDSSADQMASIVQVDSEAPQELVQIATSRGGVAPVYTEGENIQFTIQVKKPLYVAIYAVDSERHVSKLFPEAGDDDFLKPGVLYTIPSFDAKWHIQVKAPFGLDLVKMVASVERLELPRLSDHVGSISDSRSITKLQIHQKLVAQKAVNAIDVVPFLRAVAREQGIEIYEDSVFVRTEKKE
ncbi:MAG: DUF4384 domain-containing protein [Methylococcales bacterium]|jgi:hypothetical protein|nr:DUF4384 domain-containing protein [Methylococcales bacterium]MBT7445381.1 DUF4384 domain-containing protein [Methylococcales bacterium]